MAEKMEIYKCEVCGNIVAVLHGGVGELICCGAPMKKCDEKTADATTEKHVPVLERIPGGWKVKVGSVPHPMTEAHFIEWIELVSAGRSCRRFLAPGEAPEAVFMLDVDNVSAREYCNVHGLWRGKP